MSKTFCAILFSKQNKNSIKIGSFNDIPVYIQCEKQMQINSTCIRRIVCIHSQQASALTKVESDTKLVIYLNGLRIGWRCSVCTNCHEAL